MSYETYFPAKQFAPQSYARLSSSYEHQSRPSGFKHTSSQGAKSINEVAAEASFRFSSKHRLATKAEFQRLLGKNARKVVSDAIVTLFLPNGGLGARLGVSVGKAKVRCVPSRNRVKRLIRESFRCSRCQLGDYDFFTFVRFPVDAKSHDIQMLSHHWKKVAKQCALS